MFNPSTTHQCPLPIAASQTETENRAGWGSCIRMHVCIFWKHEIYHNQFKSSLSTKGIYFIPTFSSLLRQSAGDWCLEVKLRLRSPDCTNDWRKDDESEVLRSKQMILLIKPSYNHTLARASHQLRALPDGGAFKCQAGTLIWNNCHLLTRQELSSQPDWKGPSLWIEGHFFTFL